VTFDDLDSVVEELDVHRVFLIPTSADSETMLDAVSRTTALGVKVSIVPRLFEVVGSAVEFDTVGGVTVLGVRRPGLTRSSRAVKRAMDIVGSSLGLFVLAPFGALAALAIKLDSPGPVFFRQPRVGRDGRVFQMIKFRSMFDGAEAQRAALEALNESNGIFKLSSDPRVTRVGRFLRRTSIDELPQLINVLRGEMSLVGPRPLVLDEDRLIEGRHRERLQLTPGMTGPWQVLGPTRPPLSEMVKTDYLYAANWSLWSDLKILLRTVAHSAGQRGI
jgi:exopolysaccharide biosynthesis polyprenyl glycosylphosphotransferase